MNPNNSYKPNNSRLNIAFTKTVQNSPALLVCILLFILPLIYIDSIRDFSSLPRYAAYGISSGIILSIILIKKLTESNLPKITQPQFIIVIAFLSWAWLSLIWSYDPKNSLTELIQLTGCIVISYSITQINSYKILIWLIIASVTGASLAALIGVAQHFNYNPFNYIQFVIPASTFSNPNFASIYFDLITPVAFLLIFSTNNKGYKWLAVSASILCLSFLLIAQSRGSWLGLVFVLAGLLLLLFKNSNFKNTFIPLVKQHKLHLLISILIPFLIFSIPSNIENNNNKTSKEKTSHKTSKIAVDGSAIIRINAYINSLSILKEHPVTGTGYGGFKTGFRNYMFSTVPFSEVNEDIVLMRLHNDPLQFFVELGFIGGLLFLYIYFSILQTCWRIISKTNDSSVLLITSGLFLAIIASGIHACFDFPFHKPSSALQIWVWFGIIVSISSKILPTKLILLNKVAVICLIFFGISFSIYNIKHYQNYINASHYRLLVEKNLKATNCISAKQNSDKMMDLFDADFNHQSLYVRTYSLCDINNIEKLSAMNRILSYDQTNTRAYITRGTIYLQQNVTQKAINDFTKVTQILPNRASGYNGLAYAAIQNHNMNLAIKLLKHASKIEPSNNISTMLLDKITNAQ